jgi:hypothetical protein
MKILQKFTLFLFLIIATGLNAVHSYSHSDPEAYIHVDVLKNKEIDIDAVLHEAKNRRLTAKNLIEFQRVNTELDKKRQSFLMFPMQVVFGVMTVTTICYLAYRLKN